MEYIETLYFSEAYPVKLKEVKQGEFFLRSPRSRRVCIRDEYDRSEKKYSFHFWDDINEGTFIRGNEIVYIRFTF